MEIVTMREKGQITIPTKLRKKLGLEPGSELKIFSSVANDDGFKVAKVGSVMELAGSLPKPEKAFSIDEINDGIEKGASEDGSL